MAEPEPDVEEPQALPPRRVLAEILENPDVSLESHSHSDSAELVRSLLAAEGAPRAGNNDIGDEGSSADGDVGSLRAQLEPKFFAESAARGDTAAVHVAIDRVMRLFGLSPEWPALPDDYDDSGEDADEVFFSSLPRVCLVQSEKMEDREELLQRVVKEAFRDSFGVSDGRAVRLRAMAVFVLLAWPKAGRTNLSDDLPKPKKDEVFPMMKMMLATHRRRALYREFLRGGTREEFWPSAEVKMFLELSDNIRSLIREGSVDGLSDALSSIDGGDAGDTHWFMNATGLFAFTYEALLTEDREKRLACLEDLIATEDALYKERCGDEAEADAADPAAIHRHSAICGSLLGLPERVREWLPSLTKAARKTS
jgi:hypothetical protein